MSQPKDTPVDQGEPEILDVEDIVGAADTLRLHGQPTLLQTIRGVARGELGQHEEDGENWGPAIRKYAAPFVSAPRLATFAPGQKRQGLLQWCSLFGCWCVFRGLEIEHRPPELLREWRRMASAEVPKLHERMDAAGLIAPFVPGEPPPEGTIFVFFRKLAHVAIFDAVMGALIVTIDGNSGPRCVEVYENKHQLTDARIDCYGRMPW